MLSHAGIEKLAAAIVAGMIREAAYHGVEVSAQELADAIKADPNGETANYFIRAASDSLDLVDKFQADPELMAVFCA